MYPNPHTSLSLYSSRFSFPGELDPERMGSGIQYGDAALRQLRSPRRAQPQGAQECGCQWTCPVTQRDKVKSQSICVFVLCMHHKMTRCFMPQSKILQKCQSSLVWQERLAILLIALCAVHLLHSATPCLPPVTHLVIYKPPSEFRFRVEGFLVSSKTHFLLLLQAWFCKPERKHAFITVTQDYFHAGNHLLVTGVNIAREKIETNNASVSPNSPACQPHDYSFLLKT